MKPNFTDEMLEFGMLDNRDKNRDMSIIPGKFITYVSIHQLNVLKYMYRLI